MTRIINLQLVFQKPADPSDYGLDEADVSEYVFTTQGQSEVKKLVQVGLDQWNENTLVLVNTNIPVGLAGMSDIIRRAVLRTIATMEQWEKDWEYFYVIAEFEREDRTTFFRTIIPRTAITVQFRNLRRGKPGNRKHGVQQHRPVRRGKVSKLPKHEKVPKKRSGGKVC